MSEQKLADWITENQVGMDEYGMAYNDKIALTLQIGGKDVEVVHLSCDSLKHVYIKAMAEKKIYVFEYSNLTQYLQEKISDVVEAATSIEQ